MRGLRYETGSYRGNNIAQFYHCFQPELLLIVAEEILLISKGSKPNLLLQHFLSFLFEILKTNIKSMSILSITGIILLVIRYHEVLKEDEARGFKKSPEQAKRKTSHNKEK